MSSPSTFFKTELERALSEQTFGVTSYDLKSSTAYDASASVELLEQIRIDILLTRRGFRVRCWFWLELCDSIISI